MNLRQLNWHSRTPAASLDMYIARPFYYIFACSNDKQGPKGNTVHVGALTLEACTVSLLQPPHSANDVAV